MQFTTMTDSDGDQSKQHLPVDTQAMQMPGNVNGAASEDMHNTSGGVFMPENVVSPLVQAESIAIIGMSGRYPGAKSLDEYWDNLAAGHCAVGEVPASRWSNEELYDPRPMQKGKITSKWLGALDGVENFDPLFFSISPSDAALMDPQQRLFLQEAYRAIEDAGYAPRSLGGLRCGTYLGMSNNDYALLLRQSDAGVADRLGNSSAIASARIAYHLNLKGPAITVDTACSSSLVAMHLAAKALLQGEIDLALVGAVTMYLTPEMYFFMSQAGILAPDGRCKPFDNSANGIVPGEGVGVVILKRLSDAQRDNDNVIGVLRGSGINQDGKTNGITSPSMVSQTELVRSVYDKCGVTARSISYVEAHGTGTKLGDPIELEALTNAFRGYTADTGFCAIGSSKGNLGHTTSAAGIAGVHKVLLAMRHGVLPPTANFSKPNEHFKFDASPFFVTTQLHPWTGQPGEPRRAGISSFGMSGTNSHVLLEEYFPAEQTPDQADDDAKAWLFVLSARTQDQLRKQAERLRAHVDARADISLSSLAYTLQIGRDAMQCRVAICAGSREALLTELTRFIDNRTSTAIKTGEVKRGKDGVALFDIDNDAKDLLQIWMRKRKFDRLADVWVRGVEIDWQVMYEGKRLRRLHLPTYPFAEEAYWVPKSESGSRNSPGALAQVTALHPLLHHNRSSFASQRFSSNFTGKEFFLADHVVLGKHVLPGAACLEMAHAAVKQSLGNAVVDQTGICLFNVAWMRPLVAEGGVLDTSIELLPQEDGTIVFKIVSGNAEAGAPQLHCEGRAGACATASVTTVDLAQLKAQCSDETWSEDQCYTTFRGFGLAYGSAFRGVKALHLGSNDKGEREVLARIELPACVADTQTCFDLHPSVIDAAFQSSLGLRAVDTSGQRKLSLPFAVSQVEVLAPLSQQVWAWVRHSAAKQSESLKQVDIDLIDDTGRVIVRIAGFASRTVKQEADLAATVESVQNDASVDVSQLVQAAPAQQAPALQLEAPVDDHVGSIESNLHGKAVQYFKRVLAGVIKLPADRIEADAPLENYGVDSIVVMQLTAQLEQVFGSLSKTLFFEYQTIEALTGYFTAEYHDKLVDVLDLKKAVSASARPQAATQPATPAKSIGLMPAQRKASSFADTKPAAKQSEDIAIIGISGRYPQSHDINSFWDNLKAGRDCITEIPTERWDHSRYFDTDKDKAGKTYSKWGGFIDGVDRFDPLFFNIPPSVAEQMDPQQRLFLQCTYEAMEDAGYSRDSLAKGEESANVGVFVGVMYEEYQLFGAQEQAKGRSLAISGSAASIANRVSYFCNFQGPSMAIDTMCSSSLAAVHLACQSLQGGACDVAIAGGVNVSIHPNKYLLLGQGKFASSKGKCESFGEGGDGYVPGEGVGAILLKPLSKALADGDHIYGVVKGTALNHGGKANGYTVPNPNAQAGVIEKALKAANLDARAISYIEAHGTGTSLGDPIEIAGLAKAFGRYTQDKQFCAIGSAKSNIGHCESAAGVAGITKVLLQMKHQKLVPSLHSATLNPHIDFANSPFIVQQELTDWNRPIVSINGQEKEMPRVAGISSFGAGGSNAHVLIEEFIDTRAKKHQAVTAEQPALVVLSARTAEQLNTQAKRLLNALQNNLLGEVDLAELAYTLQVGREAMEERLALTAANQQELEQKLQSYLNNEANIDELYRGQVKRDKDALVVFAADEDMAKAIDAWITKGKHAKLLEVWVKGLVFDWNKLYGGNTPKRMSLPTYPFAQERYWVTVSADVDMNAAAAQLHPLLHRNTSSLTAQRYSSTFTGDEFFLRDHQVGGRKMLPGVAYLEMARAAAMEAIDEWPENASRIGLRHVVWARPLTIEQAAKTVWLELDVEDDGDIAFEVYSQDEQGEAVTHSQGRLVLQAEAGTHSIDLAALEQRCSELVVSAEQMYGSFANRGLVYGPAQQAVQALHLGKDEHGRIEVLARLSLPNMLKTTSQHYGLHPSLLDAALQATLGLQSDTSSSKAALPFAIEGVDMLMDCPTQAWAHVRYSAGSGEADPVRKLDIDVCDDEGQVCVQLRGFSVRMVEREIERTIASGIAVANAHADQAAQAKPAQKTGNSAVNTFLLQPAWITEEGSSIATNHGMHQIFLAKELRHLAPVMHQELPDAYCELLADDYESAAQQMLTSIQQILLTKPAQPVLLQVVVPTLGEGRVFAGLSGLLKTAYKENPKLLGQLIEVDIEDEAVGAKLKQDATRTQDQHIRYADGERMVAGWAEVLNVVDNVPSLPWKAQGVYLISGGVGGLGLIFAQEIARKAPGATLVLTGRSMFDEAKQAQCKALEALGCRAIYRQVDVADWHGVEGLMDGIVADFGQLNGIVHSAGITRDSFMIKKTAQEMNDVLSAKVTGLLNLDVASRDMQLDFFIFFSSNAGAMGNVGQADYAAGNSFMDAYAPYRNSLAAIERRHGRTLSVNWPLWAEGGMRIDAKTQELMMQRFGMKALDTQAGIDALYRAWTSGADQVMVMYGSRDQLQRVRLAESLPALPANANETSLPTDAGH